MAPILGPAPSPPNPPRPPEPPPWWPFLAPYLRKLIAASLTRHGVDVTTWSVT